MQFPVAKSLLPDRLPLREERVCAGAFSLLGLGIWRPSLAESDSEESPPVLLFFFLGKNRDGNGLLSERLCWGLCGRRACKSSSEELDST